MRRFLVLGAAILMMILFGISLAQAAPVGSPAGWLEKGQWDFGIEGGYFARRPMESSGNPNYEVSISHGYHSRSYGLAQCLMITGKIGGTYGYLYDETLPSTQSKTSLSGGMGGGLQLKGIVKESKEHGIIWAASGQFLYLRAHRKKSGKANTDWYEWQFSTCLAKEWERFKPYAGVKFSTVNLDYEDESGSTTSYDEDGNIGPFIGTDIYLSEDKDIAINLEGSFLLGDEFYGGVKYKF